MRYPSTSDTLVVTHCAVKRARRIDGPIRSIAGVSWKSWLWPTQVACDVGLSDASSSSTPTHASMPTRSTRFDPQRVEITWVVRQVVMCAKILGAEFVRSNNIRHGSRSSFLFGVFNISKITLPINAAANRPLMAHVPVFLITTPLVRCARFASLAS